jgi:flagellar biosynthesis/type III secretory pathway protein FliH
MSAIIKATDRNRAVQTVAFNFDDMAAKAGQVLETVRDEAARLLAEARQEAVDLKKKAEVEGRSEGMAAIEQMVRERIDEERATLRPALQQAVQAIHDAKQAWLGHWEKSAVHVAAAIAARLVRRELSQTPEITVALVREALELAAGNARLTIRLNPADHANLHGQVQSLVRQLAPLAEAELIADPLVSVGGCRIETRFGVIDQQFESQLARIEEELA